jgi:hypothetical protein
MFMQKENAETVRRIVSGEHGGKFGETGIVLFRDRADRFNVGIGVDDDSADRSMGTPPLHQDMKGDGLLGHFKPDYPAKLEQSCAHAVRRRNRCSQKKAMVGVRGFEPPTPSSRTSAASHEQRRNR